MGVPSYLDVQTMVEAHVDYSDVCFLISLGECHLERGVCHSRLKTLHLHPQSLTARPWKMVVGRLVSFWVSAYFQGRTVKLREGIDLLPGRPGVCAIAPEASAPDDRKNGFRLGTLPETNESHLKMDGWNMIFSFWGSSIFRGELLVSGRVIKIKKTEEALFA